MSDDSKWPKYFNPNPIEVERLRVRNEPDMKGVKIEFASGDAMTSMFLPQELADELYRAMKPQRSPVKSDAAALFDISWYTNPETKGSQKGPKRVFRRQ